MRILFIGNSHTYRNDMPARFQEMCADHGIDMQVTMLAKGGMGLDYHAVEPQTRFNVLFGGYDVVVMQHNAHPMGDLQDMFQGARTIYGWIRQAGSRAVLYQTWAARGDEAAQPAMSKAYFDLGAELRIPVAPVGDAWQQHRQAHPEIDLFSEDGSHASPAGSQLIAQVIFKTIFPEFA